MEANGIDMYDGANTRKRISDAVIHDGRPNKKSHHKDQPPHGIDLDNPEHNVMLAQANTDEEVGSDYEMDDDQQMHAMNLMARLPAVAATDTAEWQRTIEKVVRNVVSIRFCQACSFDTDEAITSEATGFVVDAERGYIMTNRHVVCAGPFCGYCVFDNHEEVGFLLSWYKWNGY